ncbi:hypothetical protein F5Y04DRAFT_4615 [Hypomontagnella monticulosa]|nr:hypothetical protein F5Y04DRAFT_4615 [Hypomontagnella monticulosa]
MSSEQTVSTYQKYKENTNLFTTWLGKTARACGWKPNYIHEPEQTAEQDETKGPKRKKKSRTSTKAAEGSSAAADSGQSSIRAPRHMVTTQELVDQVELVTKSAQVVSPMPPKIHAALRTAIQARQRCAAWFEKTKSGTEESNEGHQHFINILQQALTKLQSIKQDEHPTSEDTISMRNIFKALEVEYISDDEMAEVAHATQSDQDTQEKEDHIYQLEIDRQMEVAFIIFSFFEDLHKLRADLKNIWTRFQRGEMTLFRATILTTTCFEIVRQAETQAYESYAAINEASDYTYNDLAAMIYTADSLTRGEQSEVRLHDITTFHSLDDLLNLDTSGPKPSPKTLEISELDEFVFLPTGRTLSKLAQSRQYILRKYDWPPPIPPMGFNYIIRPELLDDPRMKQLERQDEFLCQFYMDMVFYYQSLNSAGDLGDFATSMMADLFPPFDDAIYSTLQELWTTGNVTTRMVFAAQILWDIHTICDEGEGHSSLGEMKAAARKYQDMFKFSIDSGNGVVTQDVRWLAKDSSLISALYSRTSFNLTAPSFPMVKEIAFQNIRSKTRVDHDALRRRLPEQIRSQLRATGIIEAEGQYAKHIEPHKDNAFLIRANLLYAGTLIMDVTSMAEEAGVALANHYLSVFSVAHLYNALRKLGVCSVGWPMMERIIELHPGPIFANDIPSLPKDMLSRYMYRLGLSSANNRHYVEKKPFKLQPSRTTQALRKFFNSGQSLPRLMGDLSNLAKKHELAPRGQDTHQNQGRNLTPRRALAKLDAYIQVVEPDTAIDYVSLTKQCQNLLHRIQTKMTSELGVKFPKWKFHPDDSFDHGLLLTVLGILNEIVAYAEARQRIGGEATSTTADFMQNARRLQIAREHIEAEIRAES